MEELNSKGTETGRIDYSKPVMNNGPREYGDTDDNLGLKPCGICGKPNDVGEMCVACSKEYYADGSNCFTYEPKYYNARTL